jgi:hypothetical protein
LAYHPSKERVYYIPDIGFLTSGFSGKKLDMGNTKNGNGMYEDYYNLEQISRSNQGILNAVMY